VTDTSDLSERQREVIHHLPANKHHLAERLNVKPTTAKSHIEALRNNGVDVQWDQENRVYALADEQKVRRVSTKHTGSKTREANNFITEVERTILRRLQGTEELIQPQAPEPGNEDIVLHITDLHIGDVVEDEHGTEIFNTEIAQAVMDHITSKVLDLRATMGSVADFDTLHVLYGGDMVTNENIYDGQAFDIESMLADQMTAAVNSMAKQIKSLAPAFDSVNVVAIPGNHGKTRASGVSKQANMDLVAYRWLDDRLRETDIKNVDMNVGDATWHKTFGLRGGKWSGFLVHGQDQQKHVDATAASSRDWRGHLNKFDFDVALRGHYHEARMETIQNGPMVVESPSPKPGGEFASKIGQGPVDTDNKRLATVFGSSDKRPMTWSFFIDNAGMTL